MRSTTIISLAATFVSVACSSSPSPSSGGGDAGAAVCELAPAIQWSGSAPLIAPVSDATHDLAAVKDPTVVSFNGRWHVYASSVSSGGAYNIVYTSFTDWTQASSAPLYYMDRTAGFNP